MRYPLLDGFRGYFLVMMTLHHLPANMFFPLQLVDYTRFGTFGAAQGFVFLSGVVVAMVYGGKLVKSGEGAMRRALWQRIRLIYRYHALLVAAILLFSLAVAQTGNQSPLALSSTGAPLLNAVLSLTLLSGPSFIDILPMYLVFMAFTPAALIALHKGHVAQVAAVSVALWLFAQTGFYGAFLDWLNEASGINAAGSYRLGMYFDRFAWQLVYISGLIAGMLWTQGKLSLSMLRDPRMGAVVPVLWALFALFVLVKFAHELPGVSEEFKATIAAHLSHSHISVLRIANIAVMVLLALWLLECGADHASRFARLPARALRAFITWRPFVLLGQHSLQVYSFHVLLIYAVICLLPLEGMSDLMQQTLSLACGVSLLVPAYTNLWWQGRKRQT